MDARFGDAGLNLPTGVGQEGQDMQALIDAQARTIGDQASLIRYYQDLLNLIPDTDLPGLGPNAWDLWGGPFPLEVGSISPTQVKVWFDTGANQLKVWNWHTQTWIQASPTVRSGPTAPTNTNPPGQLYVDGLSKLWIFGDVWTELNQPVAPAPVIADNVALVASLSPPLTPTVGSLWFEPTSQGLYVWGSGTWQRVGTKLARNVRIGYPLHTWNAGGNRTQMARAGEVLYVAGMRGIDPLTQNQVPACGPQGAPGTIPPNTTTDGGANRMLQTYLNIATVVANEGLVLQDCYGITTALTHPHYIGPSITPQADPRLWGTLGPFPPRTHEIWPAMSGSDTEIELAGVARGDIIEVTSQFYTGTVGQRQPTSLASELIHASGAKITSGPPALAMPPPKRIAPPPSSKRK